MLHAHGHAACQMQRRAAVQLFDPRFRLWLVLSTCRTIPCVDPLDYSTYQHFAVSFLQLEDHSRAAYAFKFMLQVCSLQHAKCWMLDLDMTKVSLPLDDQLCCIERTLVSVYTCHCTGLNSQDYCGIALLQVRCSLCPFCGSVQLPGDLVTHQMESDFANVHAYSIHRSFNLASKFANMLKYSCPQLHWNAMIKQATGWLLDCSTKSMQNGLPLYMYVYTWWQFHEHMLTLYTVG